MVNIVKAVNPLESEVFEIGYDGQAVRDGTMDVYRVAPVFVAVGDLCAATNRVLNRDRATVNVKLKGSARKGTIHVAFEVVSVLSDQLQAGVDPVAVAGAQEILLNLGLWSDRIDSLFGVLEFLKGEEPKEVEKQDGDRVKLVNQNGDNTVINADTLNLYESREVRKPAHQLVRPAGEEGISRFQARRSGRIVREVGRDQVGYFEVSGEKETIEEDTRETWVQVSKCVWDEDRKWEFFDGNEKFSAKVKDPKFWRKIHARVQKFGEGDNLEVRVLERKIRNEDGTLRKEQEIQEVLDYKPAPVQQDLLDGVE
mgnify:CR=1 FL=1